MSRISFKLPMITAGLIFSAAVATGAILGVQIWHSQSTEIQSKLLALTDARAQAVEQYGRVIAEDLIVEGGSQTTVSAIKAIDRGWKSLGDNVGATLQDLYITQNPNPTGQKQLLDDAGDGSYWSRAHLSYHPHFRELLERKGYYDVFLFNTEGDLIYTVFKEPDFATNFINGKWADTELGRVYRAAMESDDPKTVIFSDFKSYAPSNGAPASFIAVPVIDSVGKRAGVLAYQMPVDRINQITHVAVGLGETGETYIVGEDLLMRSDSRFGTESTILKTSVGADAVEDGLAGNTGVHKITDYRGKQVISAYKPVNILGAKWVVLGEIEEAEAMGPVHTALWIAAFSVLAVVVVGVLVGTWFARSITNPIGRLIGNLRSLSGGDLDIDVFGTSRKDEIGEIAVATDLFKQNMIRARQMEAEAAEAEKRAAEEKRRNMDMLANQFEERVGSIVDIVASAATELEATAQNLTAMMTETNNQAGSVSSASTQASANVETVAAACEEMAASIREIGSQVRQASSETHQAVLTAQSTRAIAEGLSTSVAQISEVVQLIQDIAEQTNLLALNATIEAARAGDAGKGFAVVASEVKNLATQTARATETITGQIGKVETITGEMVDAVDKIATVIGRTEQSAQAIASAVEQQDATTGEISRNVAEAASGTQEVSVAIVEVSRASGEGGVAASQVLESASELSRSAARLGEEVAAFIKTVRSS